MKNDALPRSLFFLAGAASGLALGFYLHSEKGQALREQLSEHWQELLENFGEQAQEQMQLLLKNLNAALENGAIFPEAFEDQQEEPIQTASEEVREQFQAVESSFESGMDKARARLQQKLASAGLDPNT